MVCIALLKLAHIIVQQQLRLCPIIGRDTASINFSKLNHYLIEQLQASVPLNVLVIVCYLAITSFLLGIVFRESLSEQFIIDLVNIAARESYVVGYAPRVHVFGNKLAVVVIDYPVVHTKGNRKTFSSLANEGINIQEIVR